MSKSVGASAPSAQVQAPKITAAHVRAAIKRAYPHPEFGCVFEVAQATGHSAHRHLDAIVMDTWPSRGLTISGIEVKVDRYDWQRERRNPEKAEQLARFCNLFYVAAPAGLIPVDEIPAAWGLLELDGVAASLQWRKKATPTKAEPVTLEFLAAIMRAAGRPIDPESLDAMLAARSIALEADFNDRVEHEAERKTKRADEDAKNWRKLMEHLGEGANVKEVLKWGLYGDDTLISVIAAVRKAGIMESLHGLASLQASTRDFLEKLDTAMLELHVKPKDGEAALYARRSGPRSRGKVRK